MGNGQKMNYMRTLSVIFAALFLLAFFGCEESNPPKEEVVKTAPPFDGTIFLDGDIITENDPTTFQSLEAMGQGNRTMFDRRTNGWENLNPYLFEAKYSDGLQIEMQVNPEFGSQAAAQVEAEKYAEVIGRLSTSLRKDVQTSWIHKGNQPFGGGNNNLLIHVEQADFYVADGILEETLVHEASHTSLDAAHADAEGWRKAQEDDPAFISTYARDNPDREDIAESYLLYLALTYRGDRISQTLKDQIREAIPNRLAYFESLNLDMFPIE